MCINALFMYIWKCFFTYATSDRKSVKISRHVSFMIYGTVSLQMLYCHMQQVKPDHIHVCNSKFQVYCHRCIVYNVRGEITETN